MEKGGKRSYSVCQANTYMLYRSEECSYPGDGFVGGRGNGGVGGEKSVFTRRTILVRTTGKHNYDGGLGTY